MHGLQGESQDYDMVRVKFVFRARHRERQPGYPVPVPNLKRATCLKPTMCEHASGSTRLGSKGRVRVIVELSLS